MYSSSASNTLSREQRNRILHDRARYMERILKHEIRGISLDTESLRVRAEAITGEGNRREGSAGATDSSCDDELVIGDETCTIDPVDGDTATRVYTNSQNPFHEANTCGIDYSGEFSYWNFSMRIKRLLEDKVQSPGNQVSMILSMILCHGVSIAHNQWKDAMYRFKLRLHKGHTTTVRFK